jgi:hypothetical protein
MAFDAAVESTQVYAGRPSNCSRSVMAGRVDLRRVQGSVPVELVPAPGLLEVA